MNKQQQPIGQHDLSTSAGGRAFLAEFFATHLRRHDFQRYIEERLAADFACALAGYLSEHVATIAAGGAQEPSATREEIERARDRVLTQSKNSLFRSGAKICAAEILSPTKPCTKPPEGWTCSRIEGHEGPCAASPAASNGTPK